MNKKKIKQQNVFEKVKREIKVLRHCNHPHIIKHFEFIDTPSDIFVVIEYAAGGELFEYISRNEKVSCVKSYPNKVIGMIIYYCSFLILSSHFKCSIANLFP